MIRGMRLAKVANTLLPWCCRADDKGEVPRGEPASMVHGTSRRNIDGMATHASFV
jgi:hypothetical protein